MSDPDAEAEAVRRQRDLMSRLDLSWGTLTAGQIPINRSSRMARADDLLTPQALDWARRLGEGWHPHRKLWEWVYILESALDHGVLRPGAMALCFGVGREPIPSLLAQEGLTVLATDQPEGEQSDFWAASGQYAAKLEDIHREGVTSLETFMTRTSYRPVDMNALPDDLPKADLIWSSCVLEHLGTPEAGMDFVLETLDLLEPGGVSVHTTELDLIRRDATLELGNCAVYQMADLVELQAQVLRRGCHMVIDPRVPLARSEDLEISTAPYPEARPHLKLELGPTVSTSFGISVSRPLQR
jgi:hypothetical protein